MDTLIRQADGGVISSGQNCMKDSLTGLDKYEVFLEKLERRIENIGDDRITIVYTDIRWETRFFGNLWRR